jgi:hypothetical protein
MEILSGREAVIQGCAVAASGTGQDRARLGRERNMGGIEGVE